MDWRAFDQTVLCVCGRTARFCNVGAHGGQICVSWEVVEQMLKDWGEVKPPIEPHLTPMQPQMLTGNYLQSVMQRQRAMLDAITLRTTGWVSSSVPHFLVTKLLGSLKHTSEVC